MHRCHPPPRGLSPLRTPSQPRDNHQVPTKGLLWRDRLDGGYSAGDGGKQNAGAETAGFGGHHQDGKRGDETGTRGAAENER